MNSRITKLILGIALIGLSACNGEGNAPILNETKEHHYETGMYLAVSTFNEDVRYYTGANGHDRYNMLTKDIVNSYENFIKVSSMGDATVLYYAVDTTLSYLEQCKFPDDVESVSVITFTDGLDRGSHALNDRYHNSNEEYMTAVSNKIQNIKVNGLPVNTYTIGVRGNDVTGDAIEVFKNNLRGLSSSQENAMEVANIDEVNAKFKEIAESLYAKSESRSLSITIPMPSENERQRFTFDKVTDVTKSTCYLEGIYVGGALTEIKYVGCTSSSGTVVSATKAGGVKIAFQFENFMDLKGGTVPTVNMRHWYMGQGSTTWTPNTEFKPDQSIVTKEERKSAIVALVLDCSSSLGSDFVKVQAAACNFIRTLAGVFNNDGNTEGGDDNGNDNPQYTTSQIRFCKQNPYTYHIAMGCANENDDIVAYHEFGTEAGTSPYYEIPAGKYKLLDLYYEEADEESSGWYYADKNLYSFEAGKKYTYTITDDGEYIIYNITLDGTMSVPAQIIKQWKMPKNLITKMPMQ